VDRVASVIRHNKGKVLGVAGSVTEETHVLDVVRRALDSFGRIDILVNNAGIGEFGTRLHETDDIVWAKVLDINLTGVFRMTRAVIPQMLKQGRGSIVNISSIASLVGLSGLAAYTASKGALDALTRALAVEYAKEGIRCNVVNPGLIDTPMAAPLMANPDMLQPILAQYAIRRPGTPEEVASLVLYLASDEAAWVTGATIPIDGGMTVYKG
jgi:NAD(P)-dependent dehydrogenase (short-subunit alcohol dehydrogenase family)